MDRFLADPSSTLLTPTTTMAEHIRNEFARAHVPVRPNRILTLARFLEPFAELQQAPESLVHLLIAESDLSSFAEVAEFRGFHRALAAILAPIMEAPALPEAFARIAAGVERQLARRGYALRDQRLRTAKPRASGSIILDGFFTLGPAELDFIERLAALVSVTVTLPEWPGSSAARARLLGFGFAEQCLAEPLRLPRSTAFAATSLEQEVEQIALRILEQAAQGREFREMGVLLRARDPYASALESAFARFGIPARFHFTDRIAAHPVIQFLSGIVRALLTGWDHEELLKLFRMPVYGIEDRLDFEIRDSLPARGPFEPLVGLDPWKRERLTPADWARRLKTMRYLLPASRISDQIDHDQLQIWRSTAAALNAFDAALDITVVAFNHSRKIPLAEFWPHAEAAMSVEQLRVADGRRNVVNVLDVYEARQWELPIVFVCGLNERHFPQYHREDSLLDDAGRRRAGLPTSEDRDIEECFLFALATSRATEQTILSYARFSDKGDAVLRSFFLEEEGSPVGALRILPEPVRVVQPAARRDASSDLRKQHAKLAPTSIESFLQCPFQFFARKTLRLRKRPEKPRDRLNVLLQGSIIHKALAEYSRAPMFGAGWLDRLFEDECDKANIPKTYRREAVRLELLRHFEAFLNDRQWPLCWPGLTEQEFLMPLTPELSIRGRIDRLDTGPGNQAVVIDYKYSAAARVKDHIKNNDAGNLVQGGLYLLAAEREFHFRPSGMFFCGLRQPITWDGWHANIPGLGIGESRTNLVEIIETAEQKAIETFHAIVAGSVDVRPADRDKCRYCDFNNICRIETLSRAAVLTPDS